MILESAAVPPFAKNGFVLGCERTREAVLIDPGDEVDDLLAFIERERLKALAILLTHAHVDHVSGVARAKRSLGVPVHLHRQDLFLYDDASTHGRMYGLQVEQPPPPDVFYEGSAPVAFGDYDVFVHHTPGHCPGGVCLQVGRHGERGLDLFVGDTLFAGFDRTNRFARWRSRDASPLDYHCPLQFWRPGARLSRPWPANHDWR